LVASAAHRLGFGRCQHACAEPPSAKLLVDPDRLDEPGPPPRPAVHAGHDRAVVLAHEDREQSSVVDAAGGRVELVESLVEDRDVLPARVVLDSEVFGHQRRACRYPAWTGWGSRP